MSLYTKDIKWRITQHEVTHNKKIPDFIKSDSYSGKDQSTEGEDKMVYNPENAKQVEGIPAGTSAEGTILEIRDGKTKDFVKNLDKWKGDIESPAIELEIEADYGGTTIKLSNLFTYKEGIDGNTEYSSNSNLGKYVRYYKKMPEKGDKVKLLSNSEGFFRLLIEWFTVWSSWGINPQFFYFF